MMSQPEVVHSDHVFRIAYWHNAVIIDVGGDMDVPRMKQLGRVYRGLLAKHPDGIVSCAFLRPEVPVSSAEARAESARMMKELGDSLLRVAMVSEHRGVVAQVVNTVVRGINIVARNPKLVLLKSAEDAARSLAPMVQVKGSAAPTAAALIDAIRSVRRGYTPAAASVAAGS